MHKNILIIALLILGFGSAVFAAPYFRQEATIVPISDNAYDLGTTTLRWRNTYAVTASSTNLIVSGLSAANCDVKASTNGTFSCGTDSTGASVADLVATSTNETAGRLSYWTTTSGTPAKLGEVSTTTFAGNNGLTLSAGNGYLVGGSNATIGLATINAGVLGAVVDGAVPTSQATSTLYGANGIPNSALANSTISGVALGGTLANLTATDSTLTFSGTYTGATARTIGLNVGNANTWTAAQLFSYTATTSFAGGLYGSLISAPYFHATSTTATSTFSGNARVVGNLQVDGNFFAPVTLVNSGNVRIDGTLQVVGGVDLDTFTSAILLTGAGGDIAEYAGTSCTNQAITTLSALGVATCSSINNDWWSGADLTVANGGTGVSTFTSSQLLYGNGTAVLSSVATSSLAVGASISSSGTLGSQIGGTASSLSLNMANANTWTALQTFGNATTSLLTVSGSTWLTGITSAIPITSATGLVSEYAGASCTNQFIRSLDALGAATCATVGAGDVSLANLTATDGTLTFSGTYTGATARTIGVNLGQANTWTGGQSFGNSTTTSTLAIPVGASVTTPVAGNTAIDTTSGQLRYSDVTGTTRVVVGNQYPAFTYATSSAWVGTTTIPLGTAFVAETWNSVQCYTDAGTLNVSFYDGTNRMDLFNASTTIGTVGLTTNNTFTAAETRKVDIGTPATSPTKISCTVSKSITSD